MAFVFREEKLKKVRPNTALGPGQYLPITETKILKSNVGRAPFESSVKKFKPPFGELLAIKNATPGPGKYYNDDFEIKAKMIQNLANIKYLNQEDNLVQDKYLSKTGNTTRTKFDVNKGKEKLGFEVKEKRFKDSSNINPGPGNYFKNGKTKIRAKSAMIMTNKFKHNEDYINVPSIPYNDNGFEIDDNNSLVKLEDPNKFLMFRGDTKESVGPGSYDLDNPQSWLKNGTSWSKMKMQRITDPIGNRSVNSNISRAPTRPQTALELSMNIVPVHNPNINKSKSMTRAQTAKMLKNSRQKRKDNMAEMRKDFREETQRRRNKPNRVPLLANDYHEQLNKFSQNQIPGPGYYIDIEKNSSFYEKSIPFPEFKQFFLSNNERFPELKSNELLGPATYFKENTYYNSAFNTGGIAKEIDINKAKEAPFSTKAKRFSTNRFQKNNLKNPGPGSYDPKLIKTIEPNKFNNTTNTFNFRQKRFGPTASNLKWQMETPGPGSYINPYTATGTSNTLLINGLYIDIRKGKEILRPRAKCQKALKKIDENNPGVGSYDPDKVSSIAYNNRKKAKERKENEKLKIAFDSHIKEEKTLNELKTNLGPGIYYRDNPVKQTQISPPFHDSVVKMKDLSKGFEIGPGHYDSRSYFDWNKKTYNVSYL